MNIERGRSVHATFVNVSALYIEIKQCHLRLQRVWLLSIENQWSLKFAMLPTPDWFELKSMVWDNFLFHFSMNLQYWISPSKHIIMNLILMLSFFNQPLNFTKKYLLMFLLLVFFLNFVDSMIVAAFFCGRTKWFHCQVSWVSSWQSFKLWNSWKIFLQEKNEITNFFFSFLHL